MKTGTLPTMNPDRDHDSDNPSAEITGRPRGLERSIRIIDNRIDSRDLFASTREIIIRHAGGQYRLRLTSQNKLILTK